jgi:hypothetical protein
MSGKCTRIAEVFFKKGLKLLEKMGSFGNKKFCTEPAPD